MKVIRTKSRKLSKPPARFDVPKLEREVLASWKRDKTFQRSLRRNPRKQRFTFYDGPPFATGLPHYGHLLQGTLKDIIPRFKTMQGNYVERRFGWDCHGLPVEYELEKELGIKNRQEILEMGIDTFNEACRSIVLRHTRDWEKTTTRLGRWIDFANDYKTMDPDYMESIWWVVKTLWEKGLLYEGRKSMHICPRCATPLSNFEVAQGYANRQDPAVYVKFPLVDRPGTSLVAWTTTPWTLPGNVLLGVNPKFTYAEIAFQGEKLIVAENRVKEVFGDNAAVVHRTRASELTGQTYEAPFPVGGLEGKHYKVVATDAVTEDEGTGVLHIAPAFGEEDMAIGRREKAALVQHIDITGRLTAPFDRYHERTALEANELLVADLKRAGRLLRKETITHSYPHCWRCDTPLLNYATSSWFVRVTKLKQALLKENKKINWVPPHIRDGRFGKWLEGARDWSISRNRFWGNPLPIWKCDNSHIQVVGSRNELQKLSGKRPRDLHKHFVDKITFTCPECSQPMRRIEDVLDCWFESGSMPYAEQHYPFEHKADFKQQFPADFICEGPDQTRGWFYTLHVLSVALTGSRSYKNVVTTGQILAEDGKKMSKRLKNYPEPDTVFEQYGADALRLYLMMAPLVRGSDSRFSEKHLDEVTRNFTLTLLNTYSFLATYAAVDAWQVKAPPAAPKHVLDGWILSRLQTVVSKTTESLETYDLMSASRGLLDFLDEVSNWYVRRSRRRFWKSQDDRDKAEAYATLYHVLTVFCRLAAPFTPFVTEYIYRQLTGQESVHLADWPAPEAARVSRTVENQMTAAREAVSLGLAARSAAKIKVRQPLAEARINLSSKLSLKNKNIVQIIREELHVKRVNIEQARAGSEIPRLLNPNFKVIGPITGAQSQSVGKAIRQGQAKETPEGWKVLDFTLPHDAVSVRYEAGDEFIVESSPRLVVSLSHELTQALTDEGLAREVVRHFQELRKQAGLEVSDRIAASWQTDDPDLQRALDSHRDLIAKEILARSFEAGELAGKHKTTVTIDEKPLAIGLKPTA